MAKSFDLNSRLKLIGVFWNPASPAEKIPAYLTSDARKLTLLTAPVLGEVDLERFFSTSSGLPENTPAILNGFCSAGACTLIGLYRLGDDGLHDIPSGRAVTAQNFRVSACLLGTELQDTSTPSIKSAAFRYRGLEGWFPAESSVAHTAESVAVSYPLNVPPVIDCSVVSSRIRVTVKVASNLKLNVGGRHSSNPEPVVTVESVEPRSFDWFFDTAIRLENFFSLCVGTSVALKSMQVRLINDKEGWVVHRRRSKAQKPDVSVSIRCDQAQLSNAVAAWFSVPEEFGPVENLIYGTIRHSSMFVETEFLSLAQAIESFHRVTEHGRIEDASSFRRVLKTVLTAINDCCGDSQLATHLKDSIRHANEPTFQDRIKALLERLLPEHVSKLAGDRDEFEQTLRQTRNHFTHPGAKKKSKVLTGAKGLFLFNQKLHALLRLLMLV
ncbi:MAG: hypothetical protein L0387_27355 [Acidobacteria bacterium]|nr:hypothetical protein [Acidobacteriota bacterium]